MKHLTKAALALGATPVLGFAYFELGVHLDRFIRHHTPAYSIWVLIAWIWPGIIMLAIAVYVFLLEAHAEDLREALDAEKASG